MAVLMIGQVAEGVMTAGDDFTTVASPSVWVHILHGLLVQCTVLAVSICSAHHMS